MDSNGKVVLAFVGDVCLGLGLREIAGEKGGDYIFRHVLPDLSEADLRIGNFEFCVIDSDFDQSVRDKMMAVPLPVSQAVREARFDLFNLANNHILDCGPRSLALTRQFLGDSGIRFFGAGSNIDEAGEIVYAEASDKTIAFLGFGDRSRYYAGRSRAGIAPMSRRYMKEKIAEARRNADLVVVSLHADLEFSDYPSAWRVRLAHKMADWGAHLVIQHHPHVLQGMEKYGDSIIAYSLGNFVFSVDGFEYMETRQGVKRSMILLVTAEFGDGIPKLSTEIVPAEIDSEGCPQLLEGEKAQQAIGYIERLSSELRDPARMRRAWFERCVEEAKSQGRYFYWQLRDHGPLVFFKRLMRLMSAREFWRWMRGLVTFGHY